MHQRENKEVLISGTLFDMDGVLVDSTQQILGVFREWAQQQHLDASAVLDSLHGVRTEDVIRRWTPDLNVAQETARLEKISQDMAHMVTAMPFAEDFIEQLTTLAVPWCLVTSAARATAISRLEAARFRIPARFVTAEDCARGKPHPEPYVAGLKVLGVEARSAVAFEDAPSGVASARGAGVFTIALTHTQPANLLREADVIVRSFSEVSVHRAPSTGTWILRVAEHVRSR